jgi:uncharacterized coiled-coil DUF342 family protein
VKFQQSTNLEEKRILAKNCRGWIQTMWLSGAIQEGQGVAKKLVECRAENTELQKKLTELSEKYLEAIKKVEMFEKKFPPLGSKK